MGRLMPRHRKLIRVPSKKEKSETIIMSKSKIYTWNVLLVHRNNHRNQENHDQNYAVCDLRLGKYPELRKLLKLREIVLVNVRELDTRISAAAFHLLAGLRYIQPVHDPSPQALNLC